MQVGRRERRLQAVPAPNILEANPDQRQKPGHDQEELQNLVVDGAGESAKKDVAQDDQRGEDDGEVEDPLERQPKWMEQPVENMQRLDQPRHGVHRDARREDGHHRKGAGIPGPRLLVEAQAQKLRHRARLGAVIERHHEDADENHRGDGADPVKVAGHDAVLGARGAHADHFLGAEVGRDESQTADPGRQRPAGLEVIFAGFHEPLECEADAQHKSEVQQHDEPVDGGQVHAWSFLPRESPYGNIAGHCTRLHRASPE